ncbi:MULTISPECIES: HEAT repeat domain-containing protein [unclassified Methylobacterium]|uniref:HEAT repeat domain-containing protein n=1 Tax=unclassified Methylobacterium TaxID=2615210 RepID=UPI0006F9DCE6|nr:MULTISPECIES: HEAT repeat domain-containing protein [unclassified Methylobacterium]KQO51244.1 PBS lyase [Methylobacterium sp. Leaf86]KQO98001.1 PBS lyase [Methylobacterium sp. Leaf91]
MALRKPAALGDTQVMASTIDLATLSLELASLEASARRGAARTLGAVPEAVPLLCDRLAVESALSVRSAIVTSLIRLKSERVVEGLLPFLRSEDTGLRNAVIEALQEMPSEVEPFVAELLADADSDVRIFAVNIVSLLPHPSTPLWLTQVVAEDEHVNVCAAAVEGLAEIGTEHAIPALEALPGRFPDVPFIAFAVSAVIRRIRGL